MWTKTSNRQSGRPASRTRTRVPGSSVRRLASTLPADPPPTMTTSKRSDTRPILARQLPNGESVTARPVAVRAGVIGELARSAAPEVEPDRRAELALLPELLPQPRDVLADRRVGGVAEGLERAAEHHRHRHLGDLGQLGADLEESPLVIQDRECRPGLGRPDRRPGVSRHNGPHPERVPHGRVFGMPRELVLDRDNRQRIADPELLLELVRGPPLAEPLPGRAGEGDELDVGRWEG